MRWRLRRSSGRAGPSANSGRPRARSCPPGIRAFAIPIAVFLTLLPGEAARPQESCNPVIDGTYCATQQSRRPSSTRSGGRVTMQPVQSIASDLSLDGGDMPGTFGAIMFQGNSVCIGLLRRGACR